MGKHSKNNNDRAFFSNAERKAAAAGRAASAFTGQNDFREWGWGTETRTLDSFVRTSTRAASRCSRASSRS